MSNIQISLLISCFFLILTTISAQNETLSTPFYWSDYRNGMSCRAEGFIDNSWRRAITDYLNSFRESVTKGLAKSVNGTILPTAKNMYQLFYNCRLEDVAFEWVMKCGGIVPDNAIVFTGISTDPSISKEIILSKFDEDLKDIITNENGENVFYNNSIQYVTGSRTAIGCAHYNYCPPEDNSTSYQYYIACFFDKPPAASDQPVYESGMKCQNDSDCSTYPGSICSSYNGLCQYYSHPSPSYYAANWNTLNVRDLIYGLAPQRLNPVDPYSGPQRIIAVAQNVVEGINRMTAEGAEIADEITPILTNFDQTIPEIVNQVVEIGKDFGIGK